MWFCCSTGFQPVPCCARCGARHGLETRATADEPTSSSIHGFESLGALLQARHRVAAFFGHLRIGEIADDDVAETDRFGPVVILNRERELRAEVFELVLEDA